MRKFGFAVSILTALCVLSLSADVVTNVCTVATGGYTAAVDWQNASWSLGRPPQAGEVAVVECGGTGSITLKASTPELAGLVVRSSRKNKAAAYRTNLLVYGWDTKIQATSVYLDISGTISCYGAFKNDEPSNRVWIVAQDLTMDDGAQILGDGTGYAGANGPAWAGFDMASYKYAGGAYGGCSPFSPNASPSARPYGSTSAPLDPGSGCYAYSATFNVLGLAGAGGGAIRIDLSGDFVCNGLISANGKTGVSGGASGGGIYVTCRTISGAGTIRANGRNGDEAITALGGGGGRVAVIYDTTAQDGADCRVRFEARGGCTFYSTAAGDYASDKCGCRTEWLATPGSLYFPDSRFLTSAYYVENGFKFAGVWCAPDAPETLTYDSDVTFDNCALSLPSVKKFSAKNVKVVCSGESVQKTPYAWAGVDYGVFFPSSSEVQVDGDLTLESARLEMHGGALKVSGDLVQSRSEKIGTNPGAGGRLAVYAAPTNEPNAFGATVEVGGTWSLGADCVCFPHCDDTNGAIVAFTVGSLQLDQGATINADLAGWMANRNGNNPTSGPGAANGSVGASHGGVGGAQTEVLQAKSKAPYGNRKKPLDPGSGGNCPKTYCGFAGGGVVYITANRQMTINGRISASGNRDYTLQYDAGGSGGSVFLRTVDLFGETGEIAADGGYSVIGDKIKSNEGTGAGGRIAVCCYENHSSVICKDSAAVHANRGKVLENSAYRDATFPEDKTLMDGSVYWGRYGGGLMLLFR